jgi:hypothetical protein
MRATGWSVSRPRKVAMKMLSSHRGPKGAKPLLRTLYLAPYGKNSGKAKGGQIKLGSLWEFPVENVKGGQAWPPLRKQGETRLSPIGGQILFVLSFCQLRPRP